jgi:alkanesulfonate monooxygenase SsuD/methylene tetrahydromethanopterin reductase-like flavin-dependent oxidoreductase (luciferase family)
VPDRLIEQTNLIGTAEQVRERIAAYRTAGVTILNISAVGPDPERVLARIKAWAA